MKKLIGIFFFAYMLLIPQSVVDRILAVVDNEFITKSEHDFQVELFAREKNLDPKSNVVRQGVLDQMINEKLVLAQAKLDSIEVGEDEISRQIEYQIGYLMKQLGSKEAVEQMYDKTLDRIKRELRDDVRKNLMVQRLREKQFGMIEASNREVEEFFNKFKDSLGVFPERVKISQLFMNPKMNDRLKAKYKTKVMVILDSVKNGVDFEELAKRNSDDYATAVKGGDLGFVRRGELEASFEAAVFTMKEGEISDIVETQFGYHIIQLLERRGESVRARHILVQFKSDDETEYQVLEQLLDIKDSIQRKINNFAYYAKKYSEDRQTAPFGGDLGFLFLNQLDRNLLNTVTGLKEGEISAPTRIDFEDGRYGYYILYLERRIPAHKPNLETDYNELKMYASEYKRQNRYEVWLEELRNKIYWEIKE